MSQPAGYHGTMSDHTLSSQQQRLSGHCCGPCCAGTWIGSLANLWRTGGDIQATFASVMENVAENTKMAMWAGPTGGPLGGGHWNDAGAPPPPHTAPHRPAPPHTARRGSCVAMQSFGRREASRWVLADMLQVGDIGLSITEQKSHFAL